MTESTRPRSQENCGTVPCGTLFQRRADYDPFRFHDRPGPPGLLLAVTLVRTERNPKVKGMTTIQRAVAGVLMAMGLMTTFLAAPKQAHADEQAFFAPPVQTLKY